MAAFFGPPHPKNEMPMTITVTVVMNVLFSFYPPVI